MMRAAVLIFALVLSAPITARAADFQWRGDSDLGAAISACKKISGRPAQTFIYGRGHHLQIRDYRATYDTSADPRCMQRLGFVRDETLTEPAQNPQYVAYYERESGIHLKTRAQSLADEQAHEQEKAAAAAAERAREDAQLERCASDPERTIGDMEQCEQIRSFRSVGAPL